MLTEEPQAYSQTLEELAKRSDAEWKAKTASDTMTILAIWTEGTLAGMNGLFYEDTETVAVWGMFIQKEHRRKGLGRKLMEAVEQEIKNDTRVQKIHVYVTPSQIPAFRLYRKLGFVEVKKILGKIRSTGELYDEILLEKSA